jgi:hypothetical protein
MSKRKHDMVRVMGAKKRIYRGTERRDQIRLNGTILKGFVRFVRQNGEEAYTTCFFNQKAGRLEEVEGIQWVWLARKNCRTVKVDNEPVITPVYHPGDLTQEEVLEKVAKGELETEKAEKLIAA